MTPGTDAIYFGIVSHTRMQPVVHSLRYKVFTLLFDVDKLDSLDKRLSLFSHNRFNLISFYDADHGDGTPLPDYLRRVENEAGFANLNFKMLCYPRVLGYAFNPITVYYGVDADGTTRLMIYEVNNTFGDRKTYVLPAEPNEEGLIWQQCAKEMFVSPFNKVEGHYSFHVTPMDDDLTVGVALKDSSGPKLKAFFHGHREELTNKNLLKALARTGWMTTKVMIAIHYEAAKLFFKGLRTVDRPKPPVNAITYIKPQ